MDDTNDPSLPASRERSDHNSLPATDNNDIVTPCDSNHSSRGIDNSDDHDCNTVVPTSTPSRNGSLAQTEQTDDDSLPAVVEKKDGVVILLVGNKDVDKTGVVNSLTRSGKWKARKAACDPKGEFILTLTCESPALVIVDTTPLRTVKGKSPVAVARRWISRNCLRRLIGGKDVVVVCVVTCRVVNTCTGDMFSYSDCWVDVFGLMFKEHKAAIMVLVNTEGNEDVPQEAKGEVERFVLEHGLSPNNVTFSNLKRGDDSVSKVIEQCIQKKKTLQDKRTGSFLRQGSEGDLTKDGIQPQGRKSHWPQFNKAGPNHTNCTVMPITIGDAYSPKYEALSQAEKFRNYGNLPDKEKYGPWGPERVILLGRTGSGKSTLAQMLTLGELDRKNQLFEPSQGIRGGTKGVQAGIGRGWYVLDTPGFGESADPKSKISTLQAERKVKKYVRVVEGTFSHYIYVGKKGRLDLLEEQLWHFFTVLFGKEIRRQFTVVVSEADDEWIQNNLRDLKQCYKGCESFFGAEFPPINDDEESESEYQIMRTESLIQLEQRLAALNRSDMECRYGKSASTSIDIETQREYQDLGNERGGERKKFFVRGASLLFTCCNPCRRPFAELTDLLREKVGNKIALIPV